MPTMAKRALLAALTAIGLVLLVIGAWFTGPPRAVRQRDVHRPRPPSGRVVVVEPCVLNRIDRPVTVTAVAAHGSPVFMGRAAPSDAAGHRRGRRPHHRHRRPRRGLDPGPDRASGAGGARRSPAADIWRAGREGEGTRADAPRPGRAPETVVVATADGKPADLTSLTVTLERRTWFFQALLVPSSGCWRPPPGPPGCGRAAPQRRRRPADPPEPTPDDATHDGGAA